MDSAVVQAWMDCGAEMNCRNVYSAASWKKRMQYSGDFFALWKAGQVRDDRTEAASGGAGSRRISVGIWVWIICMCSGVGSSVSAAVVMLAVHSACRLVSASSAAAAGAVEDRVRVWAKGSAEIWFGRSAVGSPMRSSKKGLVYLEMGIGVISAMARPSVEAVSPAAVRVVRMQAIWAARHARNTSAVSFGFLGDRVA